MRRKSKITFVSFKSPTCLKRKWLKCWGRVLFLGKYLKELYFFDVAFKFYNTKVKL